MAVALAFPMFMGAVCVIRSVVLFKRNRKHDKQVFPSYCHHGDMMMAEFKSADRELSVCYFDGQAFNAMIDSKMAASPVDGFIAHPEGEQSFTVGHQRLSACGWQSLPEKAVVLCAGHRSTLRHSLPLKRGMLHYAYDRKVPVQVSYQMPMSNIEGRHAKGSSPLQLLDVILCR